MIDTLRVLVSWKCNLRCTYCCNEQEQFRKDIHPVTLNDIPWNQYNVFCISGGEPLLNWPKVRQVCARIPQRHNARVILYTNGMFLGRAAAEACIDLGISAINVGLHNPESFGWLIRDVTKATKNLPLSVRFHAQDIFQYDLTKNHPSTSFRFWKMNDCDRSNEHRVVLA